MAGSAGSKYGIIEDEIPLKNLKNCRDAKLMDKDHLKAELKDIRSLVRHLVQSQEKQQTGSQ